MRTFIYKSLTITACLAFLLLFCLPGQKRYKFEDMNRRYDLVSGEVEYRESNPYQPKGWKAYK